MSGIDHCYRIIYPNRPGERKGTNNVLVILFIVLHRNCLRASVIPALLPRVLKINLKTDMEILSLVSKATYHWKFCLILTMDPTLEMVLLLLLTTLLA